MDNLAHTLTGALLSEAGLKRITALATPTLLIGANLPDVDAVALLAGEDAALAFRRGWTHGLLGCALLPPVLAAAMLGWDRWVRRRRDPGAAPARAGALLGLAYLAVLTHPLLDWLNVYGVRLLMPFDDRWYYGDALFIVDPWLWLLCAAPVVLARSGTRIGAAGWIALGTATSAMVLGYAELSWPAKAVWIGGVGAVIALRLRGRLASKTRGLALACLVAAGVYVAGMIASSAHIAGAAKEELTAGAGESDEPDEDAREADAAREGSEHGRSERARTATARPSAVGSEPVVMSRPAPGDPFSRSGVIAYEGEYRFFQASGFLSPEIVEARPPVRVPEPDPAVEAALKAPEARGFAGWVRFPDWEVRERGEGYRVILRDLRYAEPEADSGFGVTAVDLDADLRPR